MARSLKEMIKVRRFKQFSKCYPVTFRKLFKTSRHEILHEVSAESISMVKWFSALDLTEQNCNTEQIRFVTICEKQCFLLIKNLVCWK